MKTTNTIKPLHIEFVEWTERRESLASIIFWDDKENKYEASCFWINEEAIDITDVKPINDEKQQS